jgi:hypothetical protein
MLSGYQVLAICSRPRRCFLASAGKSEMLTLAIHLGVAGQSVQTVFASKEAVKPE